MQTYFLARYQTRVNATPEKTWNALTDPALVKQYFFGSNLVTSWRVGEPIYFRGEWEGQRYEDKGIVLTFDAPHFLSFSYLSSWSGMPDLPENYLQVTYRLWSTAEGTWLEVTQTNYDEAKAKHSEENWASVIAELKKVIEPA